MNSDWSLDPREAFTNVFDSQGTPKGIGNQVSAEFNFIYRWHAATSDRDEAWVNAFMTKILGPGVDVSKFDESLVPQFCSLLMAPSRNVGLTFVT